MKALRTPDDRFDGLPEFPFAPHYVEIDDGEGGTAAGPLPRRGSRHRARRAAHARRTVVVLPLPQDDSRAHRRRLALHRARPRRLRSLRQADRAHRLHVRPPRRMDARRAVRCARPARHHVRRSGLGWAHRSPARRRASRPLRPRRHREHVPAHRRHAARRRVPRVAEVLADGRGLRGRIHRGRGLSHQADRRRDRRVRRALPRRHLQERARASSRCSCRPRPTIPASAANRKAWETLRSWTKPFLTAFSDQDAITRGGDRVFQRDVPGCAGQPHTTIEGGGHFLQEDKGAELARVIVDWLAGLPA